MQRNLQAFSKERFDLLVIGGGIYGACVAWEASLQGLSVALVEKSDFGGGTSANSLKIVHGGLRYLQTADFRRMRESIRERQTLMRIAPHLVHPLPILVPTYGHGVKGKTALSIALKINDLLSYDLVFAPSRDDRHLQNPQKRILPGRVISPEICQRLAPGIDAQGLTGGAIFYDAQMYNSERLTLAFVQSAAQAGATVANYLAVVDFLHTRGQIQGVSVQDMLSGEQFEIRAKAVVNTSGPWLNQVLGLLPTPRSKQPFARAMNLVLRRSLFDTYAVALKSPSGQSNSDDLSQQGSRMLFVTPWRGRSIVGTAYSVCGQDPDHWQVTDADIEAFLTQINQAYPSAQLTRADVAFVHSGLLPQSGVSKSGEPHLTKQYQIQDHSRDGYSGLFSVVGVKYTTARDVAQKVIKRVFRSWGQTPPPSRSAVTPLSGGNIADMDLFLQQAMAQQLSNLAPQTLAPQTLQSLAYNYGCAYRDMLSYARGEPDWVLKAQTRYAVREEMAQTLSDVLFRRTELASAGDLSADSAQLCAEVMAEELGWSHTQKQQQLNLTTRPSFATV